MLDRDTYSTAVYAIINSEGISDTIRVPLLKVNGQDCIWSFVAGGLDTGNRQS
jgi:hypothetical protein